MTAAAGGGTAPAAYTAQLAAIRDAMPKAYRDRRIPRVTGAYPDRPYLLALVVPDPSVPHGNPYGAAEPAATEVAELARALDYDRSWYHDGFVARMLDLPLDTVGGHNTLVLVKRAADGGWAYRRSTWEYGPPLAPSGHGAPLTLTDLLDQRVHAIGGEPLDGWEEFKAAHPLSGYPIPDPADLRAAPDPT